MIWPLTRRQPTPRFIRRRADLLQRLGSKILAWSPAVAVARALQRRADRLFVEADDAERGGEGRQERQQPP